MCAIIGESNYKADLQHMSETITVRKIFRDEIETKFGTKMRTSIYASEYPDVRMTSFDKGTSDWKEGDKVSVEIFKKGEYTNFKVADVKTNLEARVARIEKHLSLGAEEATEEASQDAQDEFNDFK